MTFDPAQIRDRALALALPLARRIGDHKVIDDVDVLAGLGGDESLLPARPPDLAVRAESADDVAAVLELAERHAVPVLARGGGTGKSGGAIPHLGGVVIDMTRMKRIVEIDRENLLVVTEPGIVLQDLQAAVEAEGLFYPPDPNSLETCTLGGNVAHNAGGPRAFKYGVTRNYVLGLETALIGGGRMRVGRRTIKGVAGYDVTALLVGSEGTLAVFTAMTLRLVRNPTALATLLVRLPDELTGGRVVAKTVAAGLVPRVLEFMDGVGVEILRDSGAGSVPADTGALLIAEFDGMDAEQVEREALRFGELCDAEGATEVLMARHGGERDKLWAARRVLSDAFTRYRRCKVAEDVAVPRAQAVRLLEELRRIGARHGVLVASYGHAGDGNYHVNVLYDDPELDPRPVLDDIFGVTLELGGTITGEHGIGLAKAAYLPRELDPAALALMRRIKQQLDPHGLLNPGKIFG